MRTHRVEEGIAQCAVATAFALFWCIFAANSEFLSLGSANSFLDASEPTEASILACLNGTDLFDRVF